MIIIGRKKCGYSNSLRRRRLPEDHLRAGGFLEQSKTRYRAAHQTNHIPQSQQPSVTLRKIRDEQDRAEQQGASDHPRSADRVIDRAGQRRREIA